MHSPDRVTAAVDIAEQYGQIDGDHHKMWVIDQMVRCLLGDGYTTWVEEYEELDEDGLKEYEWDTGIAP